MVETVKDKDGNEIQKGDLVVVPCAVRRVESATGLIHVVVAADPHDEKPVELCVKADGTLRQEFEKWPTDR